MTVIISVDLITVCLPPQMDGVCIAGNIHLLTSLAFSPPSSLHQLLFKCLLIFLSWLWFSYHPPKGFRRSVFITTSLSLQPSPAVAPNMERPKKHKSPLGKVSFHHTNEHLLPPKDPAKPLILKKGEIRRQRFVLSSTHLVLKNIV